MCEKSHRSKKICQDYPQLHSLASTIKPSFRSQLRTNVGGYRLRQNPPIEILLQRQKSTNPRFFEKIHHLAWAEGWEGYDFAQEQGLDDRLSLERVQRVATDGFGWPTFLNYL